MDKSKLKRCANHLRASRVEAEALHNRLRLMLSEYIDSGKNGTAKDLADRLGISPSLLCDLRRLRRGITDEILGKVSEL